MCVNVCTHIATLTKIFGTAGTQSAHKSDVDGCTLRKIKPEYSTTSVRVPLCLRAPMRACVRACVHTVCLCLCLCLYVHVCVCARTHVHIKIHRFTDYVMIISYKPRYAYMYPYTLVHTCMHAHVHTSRFADDLSSYSGFFSYSQKVLLGLGSDLYFRRSRYGMDGKPRVWQT
jgi:hypothetical protein